jgi:hypothetical protein
VRSENARPSFRPRHGSKEPKGKKAASRTGLNLYQTDELAAAIMVAQNDSSKLSKEVAIQFSGVVLERVCVNLRQSS